jgi:alpha-ribazole phosphatase
MKLILVRHTAVSVGDGMCYGSADVPLAPAFEQAAELILRKLPPGPLRVISSPAERCRKLAETFGVEVVIDTRLIELNFGRWELLRWSEIPRAESDPWSADFVNRAPPGGETFAALAARAEACVAEFTQRFSENNVIIVTHAGVIRALLAPRQGLALRDAFSLKIEFGGIYPLPLALPVTP